jgi:hypothetical protein
MVEKVHRFSQCDMDFPAEEGIANEETRRFGIRVGINTDIYVIVLFVCGYSTTTVLTFDPLARGIEA